MNKMNARWILVLLLSGATWAPAQEVPRDLAQLLARYRSERKTVDDGYANGVATLNQRYVVGFRNLENAFARRGDVLAAQWVRQEREALENETAGIRRQIQELAAARVAPPPAAEPSEAVLAPLPEGKDGIQIAEILSTNVKSLPLDEPLRVRVRFRIASNDKATIYFRLFSAGTAFMGQGRPFTSADDEWEFSYASPTPRDVDRIEVELRDSRTNRLLAKDARKAKIAWK